MLIALLIPVAIIVAFIALFVSQARLRKRVARLEYQILTLGRAAAQVGDTSHEPTPPGDETGIADLPTGPWEPTPAPAPGAAPEVARISSPTGAAQEPPQVSEEGLSPVPVPAGASFGNLVVTWVSQNWFYVISALSLSLAGIFAAQYAAERGLLSPLARILLAAALGFLLIAAGEVIRRRSGDEADTATAYLPSVFSGAGVVTLYGVVLTAQMLYAMISPGTALALLVGVAAIAIGLGWFYGPLLAIVGILGAAAAPFLAGGEPGALWMLQGYFGLITLTGLMINGLKRWRFMNEVSLLLPYMAAFFVFDMEGGAASFIALVAVLSVLAVIFVGGSLIPALKGPAFVQRIAKNDRKSVSWQELMPALSWAIGMFTIYMTGQTGPVEAQLAVIVLTVLFVLASFWTRSAPGANDLPVLTGAAIIMLSGYVRPHRFSFSPEIHTSILGELAPPAVVGFYVLIAAAVILSLTAVWRSAETRGEEAIWWAIGAALIGPGLLVIQEVLNPPAELLGGPTWAGIVMAFAAVATLLAARARRTDKQDRTRVAIGAVAAMSLIALAMFILLTKAALSIALAVLALAAVAMDDRWKLKQLSWFAQLGIAVLAYRAVLDPGVLWAYEQARVVDVLIGYGLTSAALGAGWLLLRGGERLVTRAALEGGFAVVLGTGASVLLVRLLQDGFQIDRGSALHLKAGLVSIVWLISGWSSTRTALSRPMSGEGSEDSYGRRVARRLRLATGAVSFITAAGAILLATIFASPLSFHSERILGPVLLSSITIAYLLPGLILVTMAITMPGMSDWVRKISGAIGALLSFLYLALSVAQAWRGNDLVGTPVGEGELWSYTALLLVVGAGLLITALVRRSTWLRYVADGVLVIAIAKVFVVDSSGLGGLVRAASFLILGLALAALAWLNRRASMAVRRKA